jgi:hypothetical protein
MAQVLVYSLFGNFSVAHQEHSGSGLTIGFANDESVYFVHTASSFTPRVIRISRARNSVLTQDAVPYSGIFTLRKQLLGGCLAWCFRRMGFEALFCDA